MILQNQQNEQTEHILNGSICDGAYEWLQPQKGSTKN